MVKSYISSYCTYFSQLTTGDNCYIPVDKTIQLYAIIKNNQFITSSGFMICYVKRNCFLGVNATIRDAVT
ncbi:MAG: sugar O-acyltransferase, partial [bacterium]